MVSFKFSGERACSSVWPPHPKLPPRARKIGVIIDAIETTMAAKAGGKNGSSKRALLVIIVDVSPTTWGERDLKRSANDKARLAAGKRSVGK